MITKEHIHTNYKKHSQWLMYLDKSFHNLSPVNLLYYLIFNNKLLNIYLPLDYPNADQLLNNIIEHKQFVALSVDNLY